MKKLIWISGTILIGLVAAVLVVPHFIDLGIFKRSYLPLVEEILRRRIDVGEVRLSLVPTPSIRLSNLKVSDSPAFPGNTFFAAEQLQLRLKFWPLLQGRFEVTEFVLEKPVINLRKRPDGTFNYPDLADKKGSLDRARESRKRASASKPQESAVMPLIVPSRMRVRDGQLNFQTLGQKRFTINGIDLSLQEFSVDRPFPYRASFSLPGLKPIALEGMLDYQEGQSTLRLNETRLKVQDLVLPVEGNISNLSTVPSLNLSLGGDRLDAKPIFQILSAFALAPSDTEVSGPMGLRITMTGPSHSLVTQVRGQLKDVKVQNKRVVEGNPKRRGFHQAAAERRRNRWATFARQWKSSGSERRTDQRGSDQQSAAGNGSYRSITKRAARGNDFQNPGSRIRRGRWLCRFQTALLDQPAN